MDTLEGTFLKVGSFLWWSWVYVWCTSVSPRRSPEWCSRAITLVHGTISTIVGLLQCEPGIVWAQRGTENCTQNHYALMIWSWGYFAFDLLWCFVYWSEDRVMLGHHVSALIAINIYIKKKYAGCAFACIIALLEITNPLLQARWFLRAEGYSTNIMYELVNILYLILFIFLRGIVGTFLIVKILVSDIFDWDEKLIAVILYVVSIAFIYDIYGYVNHVYMKS